MSCFGKEYGTPVWALLYPIISLVEHEEQDRRQVDGGLVPARGGGQDQAARHQVPARLQRSERSCKSLTHLFIFLFFLSLSLSFLSFFHSLYLSYLSFTLSIFLFLCCPFSPIHP